MRKIYMAMLLIGIFLLNSCHTPNPRIENCFAQADSLLDEHPDSALRLLEASPAATELTHRESARYALLLAQATDKCEKPLLPCDSLLDVALDYYDDDERERAVALLYKGRMEVEQSERAIGFLLEGLEIIEKFPEDVETKKHLLRSLGNEYYDARLYEKAGKAYKELYECCFTDKDKAIALNGITSYYNMTDKMDSALLSQYKAMEYALAGKDSNLIALSVHNLSSNYIDVEKYDTALHYAKTSLQWFPKSGKKRYIHYNNSSLKIKLSAKRHQLRVQRVP